MSVFEPGIGEGSSSNAQNGVGQPGVVGRGKSLSYSLESCLSWLKREPPGVQGYSDASHPLGEHVPAGFDTPIWWLGWSDGRQDGNPTAAGRTDSFFANEAALWLSKARSEAAAIAAGLKSRINNLQEQMKDRTEQLEALREQRKEQENHAPGGNLKYLKTLGIIFLVAGTLLLFADYPLTAQLAGRSLGFQDVVCVDSSTNRQIAVSDPLVDCASQKNGKLLHAEKDLLDVFSFFDVFLLASGLILSTLLFKLTFDAILRGDFSSETGGTRLRARTLMAASGIALTTFILLGFMRTAAFKAETDSLVRQATRMEAELNDPQRSNEDDRKTKQKELAALQLKAGARSSSLVPLGFIFITILFPIASGILFHFGTDYLKRHRAAQLIEGRIQAAESELGGLRERADQLQGESAHAQQTQALLNDADTVKLLGEQWNSMYRHGLARGALSQSTRFASASTYQKAKMILESRVA